MRQSSAVARRVARGRLGRRSRGTERLLEPFVAGASPCSLCAVEVQAIDIITCRALVFGGFAYCEKCRDQVDDLVAEQLASGETDGVDERRERLYRALLIIGIAVACALAGAWVGSF